MIQVRNFHFYVFELFEDEIVEVKNKFGFWQLRLRGYFKDHKPPNTRQLKQMGVKNGTKTSLINGFSVTGKKEQLEYLKAYILEELKNTKCSIYGHKVVEIAFGSGYFNIAYFMGRRSVYAYKFDFNFRSWCSYSKRWINQDTLRTLRPTFEKIYNDYAWEREKFSEARSVAMEFIKEKKMSEFVSEYGSVLEEDLESFAEELRNELSDRTSEELKSLINKRKINLNEDLEQL